jgi:hypothetical protein
VGEDRCDQACANSIILFFAKIFWRARNQTQSALWNNRGKQTACLMSIQGFAKPQSPAILTGSPSRLTKPEQQAGPQVAAPDLTSIGHSYIFGITGAENQAWSNAALDRSR